MEKKKRFPIKTVSKLTGLSTHVIRAWEKRYHIIEPQRTDTNRRLYSEADISLLKLLHDATRSGHSISSIADMDQDALRDLLGQETAADIIKNDKAFASRGSEAQQFLEEAVRATMNFDDFALERVLLRASVELTQPVLIEDLLIPLLEKIGELWQEGVIRIMHEHLATTVIATFLTNLRKSYRPDGKAPALIVCTPSGQVHELGALIIALVAAMEGWRVVYLATDLPAVEIAAAALKENVQSVALSITHPGRDPFLHQDLQKLLDILPPDLPLVIGGRGAEKYQQNIDSPNVRWITSLEQLGTYFNNV